MAGVMLFDEIMKFNPYHGKDGRFATADGAASFTYAPGKSKAHDLAIAREKERAGGSIQGRTAPSLKSSKEFDDYVEQNGLKTIYRGYSAASQDKLNEYEDGLRNGTSASSGEKTSALGNGVYFSDDRTEAEGYMNRRKAENGDQYGRVTTAALDVGAKIGDHHEYQTAKFDEEASLNTKAFKVLENGGTFEDGRKIADQAMAIRRMSVPEYAATKGCDAVYDKATGYTVVMNQNALVVKIEDTAKSAESPDTVNKSQTFDEVLTDKDQEAAFSILKTDSDKKLVFGWASISFTVDGEQLEDWQQDMIDPEDLEEAAYEYVLKFRDTGVEHIPSQRKKGKLVESCVFTEEKQKAMGIPPGILPIGWWIGFYIEDDATWELVKSGHFRMFSVEGRANRIPVEG